jgi:hypothetical protein
MDSTPRAAPALGLTIGQLLAIAGAAIGGQPVA